MIYFWCPDSTVATGGDKQIYAHARILTRAGAPARVLHTAKGFRGPWFSEDIPLAYLGEPMQRRLRRLGGRLVGQLAPRPDMAISPGRSLYLPTPGGYERNAFGPDDVLVVPEYLGAALPVNAIELPVVVFNQGPFGTFRGCGVEASEMVYDSAAIVGVVCVSEHSKRYLKAAFPELRVVRTVNGVDSATFYPDSASRRSQIAFMTRKLPRHVEQVCQILRRRGSLRGWELKPIDRMPHAEVARVLRQSSVFLNFALQEGFGLPPVEAGLSGCLVAGYTGFGGEEFFLPEYTWPVPAADIIGFVNTVESILDACRASPKAMDERRHRFREFLADRYSLKRQSESVEDAWRQLRPEAFTRPRTG